MNPINSQEEEEQSASSQSIIFRSSRSGCSVFCKDLLSDKESRYVSQFEELAPLGEGGCGRVVKVRNKVDQQEYAVKIIEIGRPLHNKESKKLIQEAKHWATFNHPNIVRYHGSWIETSSKKISHQDEAASGSSENQGKRSINGSSNDSETSCPTILHLFIQMELCCCTLRSMISEKSDLLSSEQVAFLLYGIVQGLKYIHDKGFSHRDLNPNNILLDAAGVPRIGDFGLAKRMTRHASSFLEDHLSSLSLSKDVGTHLYKAPEINDSSYDNRVDHYSVGIILFEMSYPMKTGMERRQVLEDLRKCEIVFPSDFSDSAPVWAKKMCTSLLNHCADKRLSLDEILLQLSELYPVGNLNIKEVMKCALMNPSSSLYKQVMNSCFSQEIGGESVSYGASTPNHAESRTLFSIVRFIENVFRKYGALHVSTPLLTPQGQKTEISSGVYLLTRDGLVVNLPFSAKVNFARYVVLQGVESLTRYDTLQTYEECGNRSHPRPKYECVFDIVTSKHDDLHINDAHVIYTLIAVLNGIPIEENTYNFLAICHADLIKALILSVGVKKQHLCCALQLLGKNGVKDGLNQLKPEQVKDSGLDLEKLDKILQIQGSPENVKDQLLQEFDADCKKSAKLALDHLEKTLRYYQDTIFSVSHNGIGVSMKWCRNVHFYSGILITGVRIHNDKRSDIILADGGRFDDILGSFGDELIRQNPKFIKRRQYGCGISVYPSKILNIQQDYWPPELVIITCSPFQNLEGKVYDLARKLRVMGFNCREEFCNEASVAESYKQDENVLCLVEYLLGEEINVTHKFMTLNQSTNTISIGHFYNANPPTIKIHHEEILAMFTVSFDVDMVPEMMVGYQIIA